VYRVSRESSVSACPIRPIGRIGLIGLIRQAETLLIHSSRPPRRDSGTGPGAFREGGAVRAPSPHPGRRTATRAFGQRPRRRTPRAPTHARRARQLTAEPLNDNSPRLFSAPNMRWRSMQDQAPGRSVVRPVRGQRYRFARVGERPLVLLLRRARRWWVLALRGAPRRQGRVRDGRIAG